MGVPYTIPTRIPEDMENKNWEAYHKGGPMSLGVPGITPWQSPRVRGVEKVTTIWSWCSPEFVLLQSRGCLYQRAPWQKKLAAEEKPAARFFGKHTYEEFMVTIWKTSENMDSWCWLLNVFCWLIYFAILWAKAKLPDLRFFSVHSERVVLSQKEIRSVVTFVPW